jgi:hypothetical protein
MEKRVLHIQLMKTPALRDCNRENQVNSDKLNHRTECIIIINTIVMFETHGYKVSFVAVIGAISLTLDFINPLAINQIMTCLKRNQMLGIFLHKGRKLRVHCSLLIRIRYSGLEIHQLFRTSKIPIADCTIQINLGLGNSRLQTGTRSICYAPWIGAATEVDSMGTATVSTQRLAPGCRSRPKDGGSSSRESPRSQCQLMERGDGSDLPQRQGRQG